MSDERTIKMIEAYFEGMPMSNFLSTFFSARPENFHNSESVEIDIVRGEEEVAIAITDLSQGYRYNATDLYTNKRFVPPIFKEAGVLNAYDLLKREPGVNPFADQAFQAKATRRAFLLMRKIEAKIRRAIELQASQILQTGTVTTIDGNGNAVYEIDYNAKATHFPTVGTAWSDSANADPIADLQALAGVIRGDGKMSPDVLLMGEDSFEQFISADAVKDRLDTRRIDVGSIAPSSRVNSGGIFHGMVDVGNYKFQIWTYDGRYTAPDSGDSTKYIEDDKVVMLPRNPRFDATFGAIPRFVQPEQRVLPYLPDRMGGETQGIDLFSNSWLSQDAEQLFVALGSRPLMIPTAIDTYGCLTTL